ncbi:hypothetical protein CEQ90_05495 [Lewinellaceae bacterium SD302]|nr:hypothetical protein CEQ90_05495 [Lewinellaceae bacterium SD302]
MRFIATLLFICCFLTLSAQGLAGSRNLEKGILLNFSYGPTVTSGDLADRFGNMASIEVGVDYTPEDSGWLFGVVGQYLFGTTVKEDVLSGLRLSNGIVVGNQRSAAEMQLRSRGYFLGVRVGRIVSFGENKRSGIKIGLGGGVLSHRIRLQEDANQDVNQIINDYKKGYDRLTEGPALYQFIGYQHMSMNGRVNVFIGAELIEGFTSSQRSYDFNTASSLEGNRLDIIAGLRAGLILPIFIGEGEEIFYR